ncbi:unnamed protein product, partial [Adineta steineri]
PCWKDYACDCCLTPDEIINKDINKSLERIRRKNFNERKLLLLGNAEAGKSTFLKQMKLIHGRGFRIDEKRRLVPFIYRQILSVVRCICRQMNILCIRFHDDQNEEYARILNSQNGDDDDYGIPALSPRIVEAIKHVWSDEGVKTCYRRRREYRLTDSAKYFLDDIERISAQNFTPTDDDILRVRIPTTGIVQEDFQFARVQLR